MRTSRETHLVAVAAACLAPWTTCQLPLLSLESRMSEVEEGREPEGSAPEGNAEDRRRRGVGQQPDPCRSMSRSSG